MVQSSSKRRRDDETDERRDSKRVKRHSNHNKQAPHNLSESENSEHGQHDSEQESRSFVDNQQSKSKNKYNSVGVGSKKRDVVKEQVPSREVVHKHVKRGSSNQHTLSGSSGDEDMENCGISNHLGEGEADRSNTVEESQNYKDISFDNRFAEPNPRKQKQKSSLDRVTQNSRSQLNQNTNEVQEKVPSREMSHKHISPSNNQHTLSGSSGDEDMENSTAANHLNGSETHLSEQSATEEASQSYEDTSHFNKFIEPNPPKQKQKSNLNRITPNLRPQLMNQNKNEVREKLCRAPKLTEEDEEEISKFCSLLNESLLRKNDFWILQCPAQMDCSNLVSQHLNLSGGSQLTAGDSVFEAHSYQDKQGRTATLAVPCESNNFQLCKVPITGNIIVEETVQFHSKAEFNIPDPTSCVDMPQHLRTRHPLLGLDYEEQPRTAPRLGTPKKHKHRRSLQDQPFESPEENKTKRKKKKKKRHSNDSD